LEPRLKASRTRDSMVVSSIAGRRG